MSTFILLSSSPLHVFSSHQIYCISNASVPAAGYIAQLQSMQWFITTQTFFTWENSDRVFNCLTQKWCDVKFNIYSMCFNHCNHWVAVSFPLHSEFFFIIKLNTVTAINYCLPLSTLQYEFIAGIMYVSPAIKSPLKALFTPVWIKCTKSNPTFIFMGNYFKKKKKKKNVKLGISEPFSSFHSEQMGLRLPETI